MSLCQMRSGLPLIVLQIAVLITLRVLTDEISNHGGQQKSKGIMDDLILFYFSKRGSWYSLVIMISKADKILEPMRKRMGYFITVEGKRQSLGTTVNSLRYIV